MVGNVLPTVATLFSEVIELFDRVFSELGAWQFFFGGFIIYLSYRFLLVPLFSSGGSSDKARQKTSSDSTED